MRTEEGGGRLSTRVLAGEDGSREVVGFYDRELAAACFPATVGDESRCVPSEAGLVDDRHFADANCAERVVQGFFGCGRPSFAFELLNACDARRPRWFAVGEELSPEAAGISEQSAASKPRRGPNRATRACAAALG